jgi:ribosomal protein S18 acetylase RimI-like enzyme
VFVLVDDEIEDGNRPLGYYALVAHAIVLEDLPDGMGKGLPPNQPVGAVLLARLAIDEPYQHDSGLRLGETLLADVVRTVIEGDSHVATPLLIVDALDEDAAAFYERYGFVPFPDRPLRLGARLKDIRKTFGLD